MKGSDSNKISFFAQTSERRYLNDLSFKDTGKADNHAEVIMSRIGKKGWLSLNVNWGQADLHESKPVLEKLHAKGAFLSPLSFGIIICPDVLWLKFFSNLPELVDRYRLHYDTDKKAFSCPSGLMAKCLMNPGKVILSFHSLRSDHPSLIIEPSKFHHFADAFILIVPLEKIDQRKTLIKQIIQRRFL